MKRRTKPAPGRVHRPLPSFSGLGKLFPGIDSMSDAEGFRRIYAFLCVVPLSEVEAAMVILGRFVEVRGLEVRIYGDSHEGCPIWRVHKSGEFLFSVSSADLPALSYR